MARRHKTAEKNHAKTTAAENLKVHSKRKFENVDASPEASSDLPKRKIPKTILRQKANKPRKDLNLARQEIAKLEEELASKLSSAAKLQTELDRVRQDREETMAKMRREIQEADNRVALARVECDKIVAKIKQEKQNLMERGVDETLSNQTSSVRPEILEHGRVHDGINSSQWSREFDEQVQERAYRAIHFEESYSTTTVLCVVGMLAPGVRTLFLPVSFARALIVMASWGGVFGLRVHNRHSVQFVDRAEHFGVRVTIMHLLFSASWVAVEWKLYPERSAPVAIFAAFLFAVSLFILYCKWMCLPARFRIVMIIVTTTAFAAIAPFSTLGRRTEMYGLVATMLFAEVMAYILDKERRSTYFKTDSLRQKVHSIEGQLKLAMDTTLSAACVADQGMNLEYANPAMASMFGYTPDQLKGQNVDILMTPFVAKRHAEFVKAFLQTGVDSRIAVQEIQGKHKNGNTLDIRIKLNTDPDRTFYVASFLDLAAEKAHRELQRKLKHHTLLKSIYAKMPGAIAFEFSNRGPDQKTEWVTGLTKNFLGYSQEEWKAMKRPIETVITEASKSAVMKAIEEMSKNNPVSLVDKEFEGTHRDGHTVWLRVDKVSRRLAGGNQLVVLHDVTAEMRLRKAEMLVDIQKAIAERFRSACAFLSHEIRNQLYPQSVVLGEMRDEESKWIESIDMIMNSNTTVTKILNRVLDLAKWESGEFPIDASLFPVARLFKSIAAYAQAKGATVEGLASVAATWKVTADEHILKQAATNLVSNASKFGDGQPLKVNVAFEQTDREKGFIVVTVTDKGRGMTSDQLSKVMVPFGQIRKAGEARSGTGLGLPLTKLMVETGHKGTLTLASEGLGKGTEATMRVPVRWEDKREKPGLKLDDPLWWVAPHPDATADILVVDDVNLNRMVTTRSAKKLGLTFHQATNGAEAVECMHNNTYSMVFIDRQMPVMNGDVATERARANGYTLPIVMVSGDTLKPCEQEELKRRGVTAFLSKLSVPGTRSAMKKLKLMKNE